MLMLFFILRVLFTSLMFHKQSADALSLEARVTAQIDKLHRVQDNDNLDVDENISKLPAHTCRHSSKLGSHLGAHRCRQLVSGLSIKSVESDGGLRAYYPAADKPTTFTELLAKRQEDLKRFTRIVFHYTCRRSRATQRTFVLLVQYTWRTGLVTFHGFSGDISSSEIQQIDWDPLHYDGWLHGKFSKTYRVRRAPGVRIHCSYLYRAYVAGQVYPDSVSTEVTQDSSNGLRFAPAVTEQCIRIEEDPDLGYGDCCPETELPTVCTVNRLVVESLGPF